MEWGGGVKEQPELSGRTLGVGRHTGFTRMHFFFGTYVWTEWARELRVVKQSFVFTDVLAENNIVRGQMFPKPVMAVHVNSCLLLINYPLKMLSACGLAERAPSSWWHKASFSALVLFLQMCEHIFLYIIHNMYNKCVVIFFYLLF